MFATLTPNRWVPLGVGLIERNAERKVFVPWSRITAESLFDEAA